MPPGYSGLHVDVAVPSTLRSSAPRGAPPATLQRCRVRRPRRLAVQAKRSDKKKQARKSERRRELHEFRQEREERRREAELAAVVPPTPPPTSVQDAQARVEAHRHRLVSAAVELKARKQAARDSGEYSPLTGFKLIPEVQSLLEGLATAKVALQEAVLEEALWRLAEVSGKSRSLAEYNWSWGVGVEENCDSCGYILSNCKKFDAKEAAAIVMKVMEEADVGHEIAPSMRDWLKGESAGRL